ncbi:MAG: oligosaccharide flippase family protein [Bacteroidia bacterium]|nr:oligosaccharide flippase family protein [Bacteroidia bacterium]
MNIRQIITGTSVYTALGLLPALSRVILLPVFLLYLPPEEFALISLYTLLTAIFPVFMTLSLEHSLIRHYFDYRKNRRLLNTYVSTILLFVIIVSLIIAAVFFPFGDWAFRLLFKSERFNFSDFGMFVLLQSLACSLISVMNAYFRTAQWMKTFALFSLGQLLLTTGAEAYAILSLHGNALTVVEFKTWSTIAVTVLFLIYLLVQTGIRFDRRFLPSSMNYALPVIPYVLFGIIFTSFDRIVIENELNLTLLAAFNLAAAIGGICDTFITAIQNATYPAIYDLFKKGYHAHSRAIHTIYRFKGSLILLGAGALGLLAYPLIHAFIREEYLPATGIVPLLMAGFVPRFYYIAYSEPVFFFRQTRRLPALNFIMGVVSVSANLVLIPVLGIAGAAFSSLAARLAQLLPAINLYRSVSDFRFHFGTFHAFCAAFFILSLIAGTVITFTQAAPLLAYILLSLPLLTALLSFFGIRNTIRTNETLADHRRSGKI